MGITFTLRNEEWVGISQAMRRKSMMRGGKAWSIRSREKLRPESYRNAGQDLILALKGLTVRCG